MCVLAGGKQRGLPLVLDPNREQTVPATLVLAILKYALIVLSGAGFSPNAERRCSASVRVRDTGRQMDGWHKYPPFFPSLFQTNTHMLRGM